MSNKIHFIFTGGTIDKVYDPIFQTTTSPTESSIPDYISGAIKPHFDFSHETICLIDSRDMTDETRQDIAQAILKSGADRIIVTHGTDTMEMTAEYLKNKIPHNANKTVILTGSIIPLKEFTMSDSGFNLGYAAHCAQTLESGIYICMHAHTFKAGHVAKDVTQARFEEK